MTATTRPPTSLLDAMKQPTLARRLAACRRAKGLTQAQIAAFTGMGRPTVAMWEGGRMRPGLDLFFDLAEAFDVDPVALYRGAT